MKKRDPISIRDPIHGSIPVTASELKLIDQRAFQRLRNIKQLGFADLAFPGATHTRYSHSLGAMHLATRIFDRLFRPGDLSEPVRQQFRQTVRLAVLFHDIGHAPLSHTTEMLMPPMAALGLSDWVKPAERQASHEDYTLKIILDSPLAEAITTNFADESIAPRDIAALVNDEVETPSFIYNGVNYGTILRQIVSSECDADRMDYLQRDSFYCGVSYGNFDLEWLIDNLLPIEQNSGVYLGLKARGIFSFEDFLLSRYHMFASVYLHHTPVIFEKMLEKLFASTETAFVLPADIEAYVSLDDVDLWQQIRQSSSPWAARIVTRRPYYLLDERNTIFENQGEDEIDHLKLSKQLIDSGLDCVHTRSKSVLSKYWGKGATPIFVQTNTGKTVSLESYTPLYTRYSRPVELSRVFVRPDQRDAAFTVLTNCQGHPSEKGA